MKTVFLQLAILISIFLGASAHSGDREYSREVGRKLNRSESNKEKSNKKVFKRAIPRNFNDLGELEEIPKEKQFDKKRSLLDIFRKKDKKLGKRSGSEGKLVKNKPEETIPETEEPKNLLEERKDSLEEPEDSSDELKRGKGPGKDPRDSENSENSKDYTYVELVGDEIQDSTVKRIYGELTNVLAKFLGMDPEQLKEILEVEDDIERKVKQVVKTSRDGDLFENTKKICRIFRKSFIPEGDQGTTVQKTIDNLKLEDPSKYYRQSKQAADALKQLLSSMQKRPLPKTPSQENRALARKQQLLNRPLPPTPMPTPNEEKNDNSCSDGQPSSELLNNIRNIKLRKTEQTKDGKQPDTSIISSIINVFEQQFGYTNEDTDGTNNNFDNSSENDEKSTELNNDSDKKGINKINNEGNTTTDTIYNMLKNEEQVKLTDNYRNLQQNLKGLRKDLNGSDSDSEEPETK